MIPIEMAIFSFINDCLNEKAEGREGEQEDKYDGRMGHDPTYG